MKKLLIIISFVLTACGTPSAQNHRSTITQPTATNTSNTPTSSNQPAQLAEYHFLGKWLVVEGSTPTCQEITTFLPNHTWTISSNQSKTAGIWTFDTKTQKLAMQFTDSNLKPDCEGDQLNANDFNQMKGINALHNVRVTPQGLFVESVDANGKPNSDDSYHLQKLP